jgi:hypothetical protein
VNPVGRYAKVLVLFFIGDTSSGERKYFIAYWGDGNSFVEKTLEEK